MASGKKSFDEFELIFGEAKAEADHGGGAAALRPLIFRAHAVDSSRLGIVASDFHSLTFDRVLTVDQLDDLRDEIGIGGSWSEFVDYFRASLSSGDVKLVLGSAMDLTTDSGVAHAKLIAHKSKGLPRISLSLNQLMNSSANDAMANFSMALFKAFQNKHNDAIKEHERLLQLEGVLASEKERNESLQKQLDALSFVNKRKVSKSKPSDKASLVPKSTSGENTVLVSETQPLSANHIANVEVPSAMNTQPMQASQRSAPVARRKKVRGVSLHNAGDDDDN